MTRLVDKERAIEIRKRGYSYTHIAKVLGVSKSTLSGWLASVAYTPNKEMVRKIGLARAASGKVKSRMKHASLRKAAYEAKREFRKASRRDLFMVGLGLYVGEGSKTAEITRFVNSDPATVRFMVRWFTEGLGVPRRNLRVRVHLYPDCNEQESLRYWSKITTIPKGQFQKTSFDRRTDKKKMRIGKLMHGTAHISVNSLGEKRFGVFLFRKIAAWSELILNEA